MSGRDDMCVCGHPRHEHCFCGMHCMHPGDPVQHTKKMLGMLAEALLKSVTKGQKEAIEHLMASPQSYELNCSCGGFWKVEEADERSTDGSVA